MSETDFAIPPLHAPHSNNRKHIEVKNAFIQRTESGLPTFPYYSPDRVIEYGILGLIPLNELRYWLYWGNMNRRDREETTFDLPTGKAILKFVHATYRKYFNVPKQEIAVTRNEGYVLEPTLPIRDLNEFLNQFRTDKEFNISNSQEDRERVMLALDEFVGKYI